MTASGRTPPPARAARTDAERPDWFRAFLTDRATRKPSPHTLQAYRQDFDAIAALVAGDRDNSAALTPPDITKDSMRHAFATFASTHEAASGSKSIGVRDDNGSASVADTVWQLSLPPLS